MVIDVKGLLRTWIAPYLKILKDEKKVVHETKTGSFSLDNSMIGKTILCNSAGLLTVTCPVSLPNGFWCIIRKKGVGDITCVDDGTSIVEGDSLTLTTQYCSIVIEQEGSDTFNIEGRD